MPKKTLRGVTYWDTENQRIKLDIVTYFRCVKASENLKFGIWLAENPEELGPGTSEAVSLKHERGSNYLSQIFAILKKTGNELDSILIYFTYIFIRICLVAKKL